MNYTWILEPDDKYEVINNKHDTGYKYLLSVKRVFIQLLKSFVDKSWEQMIYAIEIAMKDMKQKGKA